MFQNPTEFNFGVDPQEIGARGVDLLLPIVSGLGVIWTIKPGAPLEVLGPMAAKFSGSPPISTNVLLTMDK